MTYQADTPFDFDTLPCEIWLHIGEYLPLVALECLEKTCIPARRVFASYKRVRRAAAEEQFRKLTWMWDRQFVFHHIILGIIRQDYAPRDISVLLTRHEINTRLIASLKLKEALEISTHEEGQLRELSFNSWWMKRDHASQIWNHLMGGSDDAALCLLILLLPRLKRFSVPDEAPLLEKTFTAIARQYHASCETRPNHTSLPLQQLAVLETSSSDQHWGLALETVAIYSTIPTVRRIIIYCCRDQESSGWPAGLGSKATEVYLVDSSVSESAIRVFASGIQSACVIRMNYNTYGGDYLADDGLTWDHYTISFENGVRRESIELRYREENEWEDFGENSPSSDCSDGMNRLRKGGDVRGPDPYTPDVS